jgi:hypothetical protein
MNWIKYIVSVVLVLGVVGVCYGQVYPPPEGVASFTVAGQEVVWNGELEGYQTVGYVGGNNSIISASTDAWVVNVGEWRDETSWEIPYEEGVSPIRSGLWGAHSLTITNVMDGQGNTWVDPQTGQPWSGGSGVIDGNGIVDVPGSVEEIAMGVGVWVLSGLGALAGLYAVRYGWSFLRGV